MGEAQQQNGGVAAINEILQRFVGWMAALLAAGLIALVASHINLMMQVASLRESFEREKIATQESYSRLYDQVRETNSILARIEEEEPLEIRNRARSGRSSTAGQP